MIARSMNPLQAIEVPDNPFPGLRPFEFHESDVFFGRDGQSEKLIAKLVPARFVAVVGTSGSGKSSLIRAGVAPALLGGFTPDVGSKWRVALLRPGNKPIYNLARALNARDVFGSEDEEHAALRIALTDRALRRGSRGLIEAVRQSYLPATENLLIVVDQFEELFRFAREGKRDAFANEAAAFVKLLLEARSQREVNIYIALTMRSDFLGDCARFLDLPEVINESQYLIPRLTRDQLREAITGPVFVADGEIAQPLVNRLLNDIGDDQDQLPILQHALMRAWGEWRNRNHTHELDRGPRDPQPVDRMNLCCYEAVGGWREALSLHADVAFAELTAQRRQIAEKMFKLLTEKDRDNRAIRRLTRLGDICSVADASPAEVKAVIETFRKSGRSFLLTPAGTGTRLTEDAVIDISHESLIRNWLRLNAWVDEEAVSANEYRRLADTAERYEQGRESFLSGNGLQTALAWREKQAPTQPWAQRYYGPFDEAAQRHYGEFGVVMEFLDGSRRARRLSLLRSRLINGALLLILTLICIGALVILNLRHQRNIAQINIGQERALLSGVEIALRSLYEGEYLYTYVGGPLLNDRIADILIVDENGVIYDSLVKSNINLKLQDVIKIIPSNITFSQIVATQTNYRTLLLDNNDSSRSRDQRAVAFQLLASVETGEGNSISAARLIIVIAK